VAMHTTPIDDPVAGVIVLADLGDSAPAGDVFAWDWRAGTGTVLSAGASVPVTLEREAWTYLVLAPLLCGGRLAVVGDAATFTTAGDARVEVTEVSGGADLTVKGAGETVTITGWAASPPSVDGLASDHDPNTGVWKMEVPVPSRGWTTIAIRL